MVPEHLLADRISGGVLGEARAERLYLVRGLAVMLLDADPQGSASSWADRAEHRGTPLPFPVVPVAAADLASVAAGGAAAGLVVVDTPPGTAGVIDAAIDAADLVIIPSGAAPADIDRVWPTLDLTTHRAAAMALSR